MQDPGRGHHTPRMLDKAGGPNERVNFMFSHPNSSHSVPQRLPCPSASLPPL